MKKTKFLEWIKKSKKELIIFGMASVVLISIGLAVKQKPTETGTEHLVSDSYNNKTWSNNRVYPASEIFNEHDAYIIDSIDMEVEKRRQNRIDSAQSEMLAQMEQSGKIKEKIKANAKRNWPDDYTTQEYWINNQMESYEYMKTVTDLKIKKLAEKNWPLDFITQEYWYGKQIEARERLK